MGFLDFSDPDINNSGTNLTNDSNATNNANNHTRFKLRPKKIMISFTIGVVGIDTICATAKPMNADETYSGKNMLYVFEH
jgi:hypothetical protein